MLGLFLIQKCMQCGECVQLILTKISKIGASKCQTFMLKCTAFDFHWGCASDSSGGAYSAPQTCCQLLYLRNLIKGKEGKGKEEAGQVKGNERRGRAGRNRTEGAREEGREEGRTEPVKSVNCEAYCPQDS